jgi:phosphoglycerate dehydrogenase-like enzyme
LKPRAIYYTLLQYQPANRELVDRVFEVTELDDPRGDTDESLKAVEVLFAPLGFRVDAAKMKRCPQLRAVISNTTSIPHIAESFARQRGVHICALHNEQEFLENITPTAEHTVGLLFSLWRKIPAAHKEVLGGAWNRRPWGAPRMLSRMRMGIVGLGRIGRKVAAIAEATGMTVRFYDPGKPGGTDSLEELAVDSDVLSLHAPGTSDNRGLVSKNILQKLPAGALVINTARGELLDTSALLDLLESGHLWGAALDTIDGEYEPEFSIETCEARLLDYAREHDNLILTPHIGGSTTDAWFETERHVIRKACRVLNIKLDA